MVAKAVSGKMISLKNIAKECGAMIVVVHAFEKENQVANGKASVTPDNAVISLLNKNWYPKNFSWFSLDKIFQTTRHRIGRGLDFQVWDETGANKCNEACLLSTTEIATKGGFARLENLVLFDLFDYLSPKIYISVMYQTLYFSPCKMCGR